MSEKLIELTQHFGRTDECILFDAKSMPLLYFEKIDSETADEIGNDLGIVGKLEQQK